MTGVIRDAFASAWREYSTPGVPSTGEHEPIKKEIFGVGDIVQGQVDSLRETIGEEVGRLEDEISNIASTASTGAKWVTPVALAATGNVAALSGEQTIDGTMTSTSRVLLPFQTTPSQNGIWITGAGPWARATDADAGAEMLGLAASVNGGAVNGGKSFICQAVAPITIGTTALPFVEMLNQSAFNAKADGLSADIARTNTKFDSVLRPATQQQAIGAAAPTSGGADSSASTYVLNRPSDFDGAITAFKIFANAATTITVGSFTRSAADVFTLQDSQTISVTPGLQTVSVRVRIDKGWYPGFTAPVMGAVQHIAASNAGFFNGTLVGGSFTDSVPGNTNELQVNFTIDQLTANRDGPLFNLTKTLPQIIGVAGNPVTGSNAVSGTVILGAPAESDAIINRVRWWTLGSVTGIVGVYKKVGTAAVRVKTLARVTTVPNEMNTLYLNEIMEKGQFIGFQSAANGFIVQTAVSNSSGYYYDATATTGDNASAATLLTNVTWQVSVDMTRIAGEKHELSLSNVDRVLVIGPSYAAGHYNILGKNWASKVSLFTDFNVEGYSYGGHTMQELLDRLRLDVITGYAPIHPKNMGLTYVFIMEGWNSENEGVTFSAYQEDIRQIVETVKSLGCIPVLCSEWRTVYDASAHAVYKTLAEELGVYFLDMIPHTLRLFDGTIYGDFTQDPTGARHLGVRSNAIISDTVERFMKERGRPANSIKIFRKRDSITVTDITTDLMFRNEDERAERFKELLLNQASFSPATAKYYDELVTSFSIYNAVGGQNTLTHSEYLLMQGGSTIALGTHALLDVTINATMKNVELFRLTLSEPAVEVYVKDAFQAPYGADGRSVCRWLQLTGSNGVFSLRRNELPGKMHFDKLTFLLVKASGVTIAQPKIEWWGEEGKPAYPVLTRLAATGAELLRRTKFAPVVDMTGSKTTGWEAVGGTITPSNDATYQLPYGDPYFITVDATKKVLQTLDYAVDNLDDIEIEIRVKARYFPAVFASSSSYPGGAPINEDTFDWRYLVLDLIDPTETYTFQQRQKVGLWWNEVVFRAILPMRVNPLDIRLSGSGAIQLAEASVKRV
ncbi:hypothetical protein MYG64_07435 [Ensifer adhaerens]|uniref:SGNH/GDSL hydrolase family protein n=1 Tax=Ensifer adhaerens TaxID=106592 RepID=UPI0021019F3A|nr:hypothetical protein [Ensifer adhaerens]UTV38118.1 hypothetical protein MYG64_07435 [Ensifer adhaerens]